MNPISNPQHIPHNVYVHTEVGQSCTTTTTLTTGGTTSATDVPDTSSASSGGTNSIGGLCIPPNARAASYESILPTMKALPKHNHKLLFMSSISNSSSKISPQDSITTSPKNITIHKSLDNFFSDDVNHTTYYDVHNHYNHCSHKHGDGWNHNCDTNHKCNDHENIFDIHHSSLGQSEPLLDLTVQRMKKVQGDTRSVINRSLGSINESLLHGLIPFSIESISTGKYRPVSNSCYSDASDSDAWDSDACDSNGCDSDCYGSDGCGSDDEY